MKYSFQVQLKLENSKIFTKNAWVNGGGGAAGSKGRFGPLRALAGRVGGEDDVALVGRLRLCRPFPGLIGCRRTSVC